MEDKDNKIGGSGELQNTNNNNDMNGKQESQPTTDFKIAEIWIRKGEIHLDAGENFWADRVRALGVLDLCKDIVKTARVPGPEKSRIITPGRKNGVIDFVRNGLRRKK